METGGEVKVKDLKYRISVYPDSAKIYMIVNGKKIQVTRIRVDAVAPGTFELILTNTEENE